jgi:hypothetical protein
MKKLNRPLAFLVAVSLLLTVIHIISAQQQGGRQGRADQQQRRQFDPEAMMNRMMERILGQLSLSEDEAAVLKPKIETILQTRTEQNGEMRDLMDALQKAIDAKDTEQIKTKLAEVKAKRKEHKAKAEALESELTELLTVEQEAQLTVSGVVNSDGFGFGGFRGPGQRTGPGAGPGAGPGTGPGGRQRPQ